MKLNIIPSETGCGPSWTSSVFMTQIPAWLISSQEGCLTRVLQTNTP